MWASWHPHDSTSRKTVVRGRFPPAHRRLDHILGKCKCNMIAGDLNMGHAFYRFPGCFLGTRTFDPLAQAQSDYTFPCPPLSLTNRMYFLEFRFAPFGIIWRPCLGVSRFLRCFCWGAVQERSKEVERGTVALTVGGGWTRGHLRNHKKEEEGGRKHTYIPHAR